MFNPFPDKQLKLLGILPEQVCHFSSLPIFSIFCLGCKRISQRAARRLILLHPKQNIENELKWQTCSGKMPSKFSCSSGKGLKKVNSTDCSSARRHRRDSQAPRHSTA